MKVLKSATQKNVILNRGFYTDHELTQMLRNEEIFYIDEDYKISFNPCHTYINTTETYRVSLNDVSELKVVYNKIYEEYETVAIMKNGNIIHVEL